MEFFRRSATDIFHQNAAFLMRWCWVNYQGNNSQGAFFLVWCGYQPYQLRLVALPELTAEPFLQKLNPFIRQRKKMI